MLVRNLWRRRTRTILTLLGIAVGIAALVSLVALSQGIAANYTEITKRSGSDVTLQAVQAQGQAITIGNAFEEDVLDRVRAMPETKSASGMLYTLVPVPGVPFFIVFGYEPDQVGIRHFKVTQGVTLAEHRTRRGGKPIILGKIAAENMKKHVGDTVRLEQTTFRIVGIYETGIAMEDAAGVVSLREAQVLTDMPRQVMYVGIRLHRPAQAKEFKAKLAKALPKEVEIAGTQAGSMMLEWLEKMDVFAWGVAMIAALIGGVGMMNTMLMSVYERAREIGVLRAVGWSCWRVLSMILGESLLLSLLGGVVGVGIGVGLTWLVARMPAMAGMTSGRVPTGLLLQAMCATAVLGLVGGAYPAWRASRLPPVEALSYDGGSARKQARSFHLGGMALRNLVRQRTRTTLTLVGVGIGVLGMVLMGSLSEGTIKTFSGIFSGCEITGVEGGLADTSLSAIDERIVKRIGVLPEVKQATGVIFSVVSTRSNPLFVVMARQRTDPNLSPRILREGHLIDGRRQCLLGWRAAADENRRLGDRISFLGTTFTVVGIIQTGSAYEDGGAVIDLREAQQLLKKPHQVMMTQIKLVDPRQTDAVLAKLLGEYPKLLFSRSAELTENLPDMENMNQMIFAVLALTLVVGSITLMNTMAMSVYERTREIGVLRAVGWRSAQVLWQMLSETLLLTLFSGAIGVGLTFLLIQAMRVVPSLGIWRDMFEVTPRVVLQALALCVVLGLLGGMFPAWRASRLRPVEALRYE